MSKFEPTLPEIRAFLVRKRIEIEALADDLKGLSQCDTKDERIDRDLRERIKMISSMARNAARVMNTMVLVDIEARFKAEPPVVEEEED